MDLRLVSCDLELGLQKELDFSDAQALAKLYSALSTNLPSSWNLPDASTVAYASADELFIVSDDELTYRRHAASSAAQVLQRFVELVLAVQTAFGESYQPGNLRVQCAYAFSPAVRRSLGDVVRIPFRVDSVALSLEFVGSRISLGKRHYTVGIQSDDGARHIVSVFTSVAMSEAQDTLGELESLATRTARSVTEALEA